MEWVTIPGMVSGAALKKKKSWPLVLQLNSLRWCAGVKSRVQSLLGLGLERMIFTITDEGMRGHKKGKLLVWDLPWQISGWEWQHGLYSPSNYYLLQLTFCRFLGCFGSTHQNLSEIAQITLDIRKPV